MSIRGSCLCGRIKYEIDEVLDGIEYCHCRFCQKITGTAFGSYINVLPEHFHWLEGRDDVAHYQSSQHSGRLFCPNCSSLIASDIDGGKLFGVALGTLDDDAGVRSGEHIFVGSKAPWYEVRDGLPTFSAYPPRYAHLTPTARPPD